MDMIFLYWYFAGRYVKIKYLQEKFGKTGGKRGPSGEGKVEDAGNVLYARARIQRRKLPAAASGGVCGGGEKGADRLRQKFREALRGVCGY